MSVVYSIGDEAARKQLLDGLVGVLQGKLRQRRHDVCRDTCRNDPCLVAYISSDSVLRAFVKT